MRIVIYSRELQRGKSPSEVDAAPRGDDLTIFKKKHYVFISGNNIHN